MADEIAHLPVCSPLVRKRKDIECEIAVLRDEPSQQLYLDALRFQTAALLGQILARDARQLLKCNAPKWIDETRSRWEQAKRSLLNDWRTLFPDTPADLASMRSASGPIIDVKVLPAGKPAKKPEPSS